MVTSFKVFQTATPVSRSREVQFVNHFRGEPVDRSRFADICGMGCLCLRGSHAFKALGRSTPFMVPVAGARSVGSGFRVHIGKDIAMGLSLA